MPLMTNGNKQTDIHNKNEKGSKDVQLGATRSENFPQTGDNVWQVNPGVHNIYRTIVQATRLPKHEAWGESKQNITVSCGFS